MLFTWWFCTILYQRVTGILSTRQLTSSRHVITAWRQLLTRQPFFPASINFYRCSIAHTTTKDFLFPFFRTGSELFSMELDPDPNLDHFPHPSSSHLISHLSSLTPYSLFPHLSSLTPPPPLHLISPPSTILPHTSSLLRYLSSSLPPPSHSHLISPPSSLLLHISSLLPHLSSLIPLPSTLSLIPHLLSLSLNPRLSIR